MSVERRRGHSRDTATENKLVKNLKTLLGFCVRLDLYKIGNNEMGLRVVKTILAGSMDQIDLGKDAKSFFSSGP